nr:MAG TPA: hypothetical protein [Caudoviricetes sp.]
MAERYVWGVEVVGSNPTIQTMENVREYLMFSFFNTRKGGKYAKRRVNYCRRNHVDRRER